MLVASNPPDSGCGNQTAAVARTPLMQRGIQLAAALAGELNVPLRSADVAQSAVAREDLACGTVTSPRLFQVLERAKSKRRKVA